VELDGSSDAVLLPRSPQVTARARFAALPIVGGLAIALAVLGSGATPLEAQEGCICDPSCDQLNVQSLPGIGQVTYVSGARFACEGGIRILADSAVSYSDRGYSELIGSVRYFEASRELVADQARYFTNEGRLQAEGHMSVRDDEQGSRIENGDLVYLLQTDFRDEASMTVTTGADGLRPRAFLTPPDAPAEPDTAVAVRPDTTVAVDREEPDTTVVSDSTRVTEPAAGDTVPPTPYRVESDRMFLQGEGFFTAAGSVEIVRDSLFAFGDSAVYDREAGDLVLEGSARVDGEAYELVGRQIAMASPGAATSRIRALREARLVGEGFDLRAAQILVFLRDEALDRLVATPIARPAPGEAVADSADLERPEAVVEDFVLTADSLEIVAPEEAIERVFAAGRARSMSSSGDSLNVDLLPEIARTDWLEGDTIIVTFVPDEAATTSSGVQVDAITALVSARSLYRLPANDSSAVAGTDPPAVHYVLGDSIRIELIGGQVSGMRVSGQTRGVHLEPLPRSAPDTAAVSDSMAVPDTGSVAVDTGAVSAPHAGPEGGVSPDTPEQSERERAREHPRLEEVPWIRP